MNQQEIDLYTKLSKTKIYGERFTRAIFGDTACDNVQVFLFDDDEKYYDFIIPPVFDPENPERCLWGMMEWNRMEVNVRNDGTIRVFGNTSRDRLDLALIKAILAQEGGKP